jgi:hypothetical protein
MAERNNPSRRAARDEGAPEEIRDEGAPRDEEAAGDERAPSSHTIARPDANLPDVQVDVVEARRVRSSLPAGPENDALDPGALTPHVPAASSPTVTPGDAPAGSTWHDRVDQEPVSQVNELAGPVPTLAYVVVWNRAAVHVRVDAAQTRKVGDGDDATEERFLTVQSAAGAREVVLEGEQVTLQRGEVLPEETAEGQGPFLVNIGGAVAVSIPPGG